MLRDLVVLLGAGVASFLAPCVVPLLPAYLGMVAGEAVPVANGESGPRSVGATAVFVLGFAVVFAVLGAAAGLEGGSLQGVQSAVQ